MELTLTYSCQLHLTKVLILKNLEQQSALWFIAGTKHGYHTISLGLYMNEVIKRADPKGRPIWVVFDEDIAQKFGNQHYK